MIDIFKTTEQRLGEYCYLNTFLSVTALWIGCSGEQPLSGDPTEWQLTPERQLLGIVLPLFKAHGLPVVTLLAISSSAGAAIGTRQGGIF